MTCEGNTDVCLMRFKQEAISLPSSIGILYNIFEAITTPEVLCDVAEVQDFLALLAPLALSTHTIQNGQLLKSAVNQRYDNKAGICFISFIKKT